MSPADMEKKFFLRILISIVSASLPDEWYPLKISNIGIDFSLIAYKRNGSATILI